MKKNGMLPRAGTLQTEVERTQTAFHGAGRLTDGLRQLGAALLDIAAPARCPLCLRVSSGGFCHGCRELLPWITTACEACCAALPSWGTCPSCARRSPDWDAIHVPLRYTEPVTGLLHELKYQGRIQQAVALGSLLAESVMRRTTWLPDVLLPIPLHHSRIRSRGFNQAELVARKTGALLGIPVDNSLLYRTRDTPSQTNLDERGRRKNLKNAFAVSASGRYDAVAVVDDVITSGATMGAACRVLRRHGYSRVSVWAIAKT